MRSRQTSVIILTFLAGLILWRVLDFSDAIDGGMTSTSATTIADDESEWEIEKSLGEISNATLGFERVFAIGFEDRMDKRDAMTIGASLSGMKLEWIEGVRWKDINEKAYPAGWDKRRNNPAELGAWRAHLNVLQKIVADGISTALIFEDDIDWDVTIRAQLIEFSRGARALQNTNSSSPHSPYGDDWEVLWLGACAMRTRDASYVYQIPDDPTVPPFKHRGEMIYPPFVKPSEMHKTRFVLERVEALCTLAYAVTYESARSILASLSLQPTNMAFDVSMNHLCMNKDLRCLGSYPVLFNTWRKEGTNAHDSDIHDDWEDVWHEKWSKGITYSTMLNVWNLIGGGKTVQAQYPEVSPQWIEFEKLEIPRGKLETYELTLGELTA
ncbi:uncharacterized protein PFLUO_LOCUS9072 [Penicillium psychrofluorescens]|uniref:uncharacterized protein n=1 Tax=Penicillium psychrofluorescens TaxID=3158075 RepID=UPI003CCE16C9